MNFRKENTADSAEQNGACEFRTTENLQRIEKIMTTIGLREIEGLLTNEETGDALTKIEGVEDWIKDLRAYALDQVLKGETIPGWKAVEGRSNRTIVDVDKAFEILEANGFDQAILYEKKPLTLTELEKVVGKKQLADAIGDYIEKPKGKPTLAKESDKREPFRVSAAEEFGNLEMEENE